MLLIGGYSPENGFNHHLLEFNIHSGNWTVTPHTGTPPTGQKDLSPPALINSLSTCQSGKSLLSFRGTSPTK